MKSTQYAVIISLFICFLILYFKSKEVYRLKRENAKLKEMLAGCNRDLSVHVQYVKNYEKAFEIIERHFPYITKTFDLLINGIDPWQKRSTKTRPNLKSGGKTTPVSRYSNGTSELIPVALYR